MTTLTDIGPSQVTNPDPLLDVSAAAAYLGVGIRFVRRIVEERRVRVVHVGRHVRITRSALDEFLAAGVTPAREDHHSTR